MDECKPLGGGTTGGGAGGAAPAGVPLVQWDHLAFRTFGVPGCGIESVATLFKELAGPPRTRPRGSFQLNLNVCSRCTDVLVHTRRILHPYRATHFVP